MIPDKDRHDSTQPGPVAPEIVQVGLRLALLLILPAILLLLLLPRDSPEFTITVFTLAMGGVFLGFVGVLYWLASRK